MNFDFAGYFISFFLNSRKKVQNNQWRCSPYNLACSFISSVIRLLILTKAIDIRSFQVRRRRNVRDGKDIENNSHLEAKDAARSLRKFLWTQRTQKVFAHLASLMKNYLHSSVFKKKRIFLTCNGKKKALKNHGHQYDIYVANTFLTTWLSVETETAISVSNTKFLSPLPLRKHVVKGSIFYRITLPNRWSALSEK